MVKKFGPQIKKLQNAINEKYDKKILVNHSQFYYVKKGRPRTVIVIKQAYWDESKQKYATKELFSSMSDIQIVLWLRDYWYELNGWEVPHDNEKWEEAKQIYYERHLPTSDTPDMPGMSIDKGLKKYGELQLRTFKTKNEDADEENEEDDIE